MDLNTKCDISTWHDVLPTLKYLGVIADNIAMFFIDNFKKLPSILFLKLLYKYFIFEIICFIELLIILNDFPFVYF